MINNAGLLVDYIKGAVEQNNANPQTEVFVRIGDDGPLYRIHQMKGQSDLRGLRLVLQTSKVPIE